MTHPKLGHFELLEQIGKGGMATVFLAYDPSLDRKVAIKLLDEDLAHKDHQFVENFIREARITASISHPNIVQIYSVDQEDGNYYIAMELLEGHPLHEIIKKEGPLNESQALRILFQVVNALQAAYEKQMIHGDIKPMNLFITHEGNTKLVDFGLAKRANIESSVESKRTVWGSAYYISPERVGRKAEDFRSDIYSLGATMFHALVGRPPFTAETSEKLAQKRLNEKAPEVRSLNPAISEKTSEIVGRMLNKSVFLRYLDYAALLSDLRSVQLEGDVERASSKIEAGQHEIRTEQGALLVQMRESLLKIKSKLTNTTELIKLLNPVEQEIPKLKVEPLKLIHPLEPHPFVTTVEPQKHGDTVEPCKPPTISVLPKETTPNPELQSDQVKTEVILEDTIELSETNVAKKHFWPLIIGALILLCLIVGLLFKRI